MHAQKMHDGLRRCLGAHTPGSPVQATEPLRRRVEHPGHRKLLAKRMEKISSSEEVRDFHNHRSEFRHGRSLILNAGAELGCERA